MELEKMPSKESAAHSATEKLNEVLRSSSEQNISILFMLSGGSSLDLLNNLDSGYLNSNTTISVLDERYSTDPQENNFAQVAETEFYKKAQSRGCKFIDTRVQNNESQEDLAKRFNNGLTEWFSNNPNGVVIATVGIGPDGHTSGIMPFPEDPDRFEQLFDSKNPEDLVTSYDATGKNPYAARVTTNMNLLRKINTAIVYAVGENKRDALMRLRSDKGSLAETPSRILNEIKNAYLFTDISL